METKPESLGCTVYDAMKKILAICPELLERVENWKIRSKEGCWYQTNAGHSAQPFALTYLPYLKELIELTPADTLGQAAEEKAILSKNQENRIENIQDTAAQALRAYLTEDILLLGQLIRQLEWSTFPYLSELITPALDGNFSYSEEVRNSILRTFMANDHIAQAVITMFNREKLFSEQVGKQVKESAEKVDQIIKTTDEILVQLSKLHNIFLSKLATLQISENSSNQAKLTPTGRILSMKIEELNLSTRTYNCLRRAKIYTLEDILALYYADYFHIRNMGKKSINDLRDSLARLGLSLKGAPLNLNPNLDFE